VERHPSIAAATQSLDEFVGERGRKWDLYLSTQGQARWKWFPKTLCTIMLSKRSPRELMVHPKFKNLPLFYTPMLSQPAAGVPMISFRLLCYQIMNLISQNPLPALSMLDYFQLSVIILLSSVLFSLTLCKVFGAAYTVIH